MTLEQLGDLLPAYARDLKLNLQTVLRQTELTPQQGWGAAVACAMASRNAALTSTIIGEAAAHLSPEALEAAKAAAGIMGMNNVYYRFRSMVRDDAKYGDIPARLRMQVIRTHGSDPVDFELWCAAVSSINGCSTCVTSHEAVIREKGLSHEAIVAAIRIASVIHGVAVVLDAEAALRL